MPETHSANSSLRLVVGVGASAGGLEAFKQLLSALPSDAGMAFLLVQHLDPTHKSLLGELLTPTTGMTVRDAAHDVVLEPNTVYVIPPDAAMAVRDCRIELSEPTLHRGVRLPVDHLFRSLAHEYGSRAVGVVLTGAGSDGTAGIRAIKSAGGLTIAQEPTESGQAGMPRAAIDTGLIDLVLSIDDIPAALARFESMPAAARLGPEAENAEHATSEQPSSMSEQHLTRLAAMLDAQLGFDLRVYKASTVERRVLRRMTLSGFSEPADYLEYVRHQPAEQQQVVRDLLISVTDFFRDPQAFEALRASVIDPLVAASAAGSVLRAWVPGCATGEEAYSIAIEFLEAIEASGKRIELQVFATDIDQEALAFARTASYPPSIAEHVSPRRLESFFKALDGKGFQVRSSLRDVVSFAVHDLTKDPPFSRMSLVSCRNVLIYLTADAQRHVLKVLHFALDADGHLFLSTSETTTPHRELFSTVSKAHRIYKKVGPSRQIAVARSRVKATAPTADRPAQTPRRPSATDLARRALMNACTPPSVVVAEDGTILYMHGPLEAYMQFPRDEGPRYELSSLLRPELATRTHGALYNCRRNQKIVVARSSPQGAGAHVRITARPAVELGDGAVIVTFEQLAESDEPSTRPPDSPEQEAAVDQLEKELQATREDLRNTVEELETSNEELRSANEESMSMNEELQSANEELEATTEELRSLNEELTTVNAQLRDKVEQVEQAHDDLQNFFASTKVATVFLDERLCVERFTPAAQQLLNIDLADTGRAVGHIARELLQHDLEREARHVLEHLSPQIREIRTGDGRWFTRQVLLYRTESRRIEGVVVTFSDITDLKLTSERLVVREGQQATIARLGVEALRDFELQDFMHRVVREVRRTLDVDFTKILELQPGGRRLLLRAGSGWQGDSVGKLTEEAGTASPGGYALQQMEAVVIEDARVERRFAIPPVFEEHGIVSGISCAINCGNYGYGVLGAFTKTTREFAPEDVYFLQAVAHVVGSAITRYQGRMRLALELGVAHVLSETAELDQTLGIVLERMAKELGSSVVAELWWKANPTELYRRCLHVAPASETARVTRHLHLDRIAIGDGFVGGVFDRAIASWATDLGEPRLFSPSEGGAQLGLVSGIAFPVYDSSSDGRGVVALYSTQRLFADDVYLRSLEAVGRSIADFIARWEADQKSRELAAITESSHDAIVSYRIDGTITRWLRGAEVLFGYPADEIVGRSIERIVPLDRRQELSSITTRIVAGEVVEPYDTVRMRDDGASVEVSMRNVPLRDPEGRIIGISSTARDVSRQKETERRLRDADRQKDEFLAMLGHELRNPLAAIRTAADLLKLGGDDAARVARARDVLDRQTAHVTQLLDGLLDISRIVRGQINLSLEVVDLAALCRDVVADTSDRMASDARDFRGEIPAEPIWVEGDRVRLTQILDNLLTNAIKYSATGASIIVSLDRDHDTAALRVKDRGLGIEPELLPHVFEAFRQSVQTLDRSRGGLGLGLALVKHLVALHHGAVDAQSEGRGKGSEFVVRLPLTRKRAITDAPPALGVGPRRILLIEDNVDAAETLREVLELRGYEVALAFRGTDGIEMATAQPPDVVLCDLGLPDGVTGFDVARELRARPATQHVRMLALSGYGRPDDKERAASSGFDGHLTKPISVDALQRALQGVKA